MLQRRQKELDNFGMIVAISMDLSKASDCLSHVDDLIVTEFEAYDADKTSLNLLLVYLTYPKKRIKINSLYNSRSDIIIGVSQGSILGSIHFSFFINDILLLIEKSKICNFPKVNNLAIKL